MNINILLVEYDAEVIESVKASLLHEIFEITVAGNETVAKTMLTKQKFDLVITEALLPKSHGFNLCKYVTENYPKTKVIIISEKLGDVEHKNEALKHGACELIEKPFAKSKFREKVFKHLKHREELEKLLEQPVGDTTNLYVLPLLAEIKALQEKEGKTGNDDFDKIIEELKDSEPETFKIDLDQEDGR